MLENMYLEISGSEDSGYTDKLKEKVEALGKRIYNGDVTKLVDKDVVIVTVETTDGGVCNNGVKSKFKEEVEKNVGDGASSTASTKKLQQVGADVDCRVVDDKPEYTVSVDAKGVSSEDIDTASDSLATKLDGKAYTTSRRVRRLLATQTTSGAYADQETTMCSETDTACTGETKSSEAVSSARKACSVAFLSTIVPLFIAAISF